MSALRRRAPLFLLFAALTAIVTYPQITSISSQVPYHTDPYFSMWRLNWVASHLVRAPGALWEGNIFFPEHDTLAFSDAMLLPGAVLAPLSWVGLNIVAIYNLALLTAIALSGFAAARLALHLTDHTAASIVAGAIYAFAPYRFDHFVHLELQITFWIPFALLYLHRLIEGGRTRDGVLLGLVTAAQALSSLYVALFFSLFGAVVGALLLTTANAQRTWSTFRAVVVAAVLALVIVTPYGLVYVRATGQVGTRSMDDVRHYGATLANYRAAPPSNRLYGTTLAANGRHELFLFPGALAVALGLIGLAAPGRPGRLAYLAGLLLAFEITRGADGIVFPWLFEHVTVFRALRVPSRMAIFVNLSLSVLGAYGVSWLMPLVKSRRYQAALATTLVSLMVVEYASAPALAAVPADSRVDRWLARQPPVVIVQLPLSSSRNGGRSWDWRYMYQGRAHQQRMLNGLSGYIPGSYTAMIDAMDGFPDDRSLSLLRQRQVDYVVLRGELYEAEAWTRMERAVQARPDLSLVTRLPEGERLQEVYRVVR